MTTKSDIKPRRRLLNLVVLMALGGGALAPASASAAALYWACGSYWWESNCWSTTVGGAATFAQPLNGGIASLTQSDATNRTVYYSNAANPLDVLNSLTINATGTGTMTLLQSSPYSDPLAAINETIGSTGKGTFTQSAGTNTVGTIFGGGLSLGYNSGSNGTYNLSAGSLSANFENIGASGTGTFNQSGGTNTVGGIGGTLYLGYNSGSNGSYNLNAGSLSALSQFTVGLSAYSEYIGFGGTGTFNQSGGTNIVAIDLSIGYNGGSNGTYNLSAGSLSATVEYIGHTGTGTFTQSGGTNTVTNNLTLGRHAGSSGTYTQSGGTLNVGNISNGTGISTFNLDGGTLNVTGNSISLDHFNIGNASGSNGSFTLGSGQTLAAGAEIIGYSGTGIFNQTGGANTVSSLLYLGYNSGSNGTYTLSGTSLTSGSLSGNLEFVGYDGTGTFNQTRGTNTVSSNLYIGTRSGSDGTYNLSAGTLSAASEYLGTFSNSTGAFNQSGGTNTVSGTLTLGHLGGSSGTYALSGSGSLSAANERIGYYGTGAFTQSGGTHTVTNNLTLGQNAGSSGAYTLSGGTLNVGGNIVDGAGGSTFNLDGGTLNFTGSLISLDTFNIGSAAGSNGSFTLGSGQTLAAGAETIGFEGAGSLTQSGGTHTVGNILYLGVSSGNGSYNLSAGSLSASGEVIGSEGTGTFTQSGGTNTVSGTLTLGHLGGSSGTYALSGSLSASNIIIGSSGTGTFNQTGGTNTVTSNLILGQYAGSSGTYNLDGGVLNVGNIVYGVGSGAFNYNGGTLNVTGNQVALNTFVSNSNFTLGSGQTLTATEGITNNANGSFNVGAGATVSAGGLGLVNYGLLGGTGTVVGNVISSGNVGPGNSPGMLSITGDYTQSASGIFTAEIGGLLAGTQYDALNVTGTAFLDGLLNVSLFDLGGGLFAPHAGDTFDILTASSITGSFSSLSFAALSDPNLFWQINYLTDAIGTTDVVRLSVAQNVVPVTPVPEPETWAMLLAGLGLLGFAGRRRNGASRQAA